MMTKEEAIDILNTLRVGASRTEKEAIDMAVEALSDDEEDAND